MEEILIEEFPNKHKEILEDIVVKGTLETSSDYSLEVNEKIIELKPVLKTAQEISAEDHLKMQVAWQKHIDQSISKTINAPHDISVEEIKDLILYAYENGIKGFTIFRDGCREEQILQKA